MSLSTREFWTLVHGMSLGIVFLLAFAGGFVGLWSLRREWMTAAGLWARLHWLRTGIVLMAIVDWLTVLTGTYIVYPWYRATPPAGAALVHYPRSYLLDNANLAPWHTFGMEWKEHVSWLSPILATGVAYVVMRYGARLAEAPQMRLALLVLFTLAFLTAGVGGLFGALITKVTPIH